MRLEFEILTEKLKKIEEKLYFGGKIDENLNFKGKIGKFSMKIEKILKSNGKLTKTYHQIDIFAFPESSLLKNFLLDVANRNVNAVK